MEHQELLKEITSHLDSRCDRLEDKIDSHEAKLDKHLEKITRVEEQQGSTKGQIKILFSILLAAISSLVAYFTKNLFGGN